jgi:hypothetical protein
MAAKVGKLHCKPQDPHKNIRLDKLPLQGVVPSSTEPFLTKRALLEGRENFLEGPTVGSCYDVCSVIIASHRIPGLIALRGDATCLLSNQIYKYIKYVKNAPS